MLPIRLQLPSLLDGLPSIEVAVVDGAPVTADRAAPGAEAGAPARRSRPCSATTVGRSATERSTAASSRAPRHRPSRPAASRSRAAPSPRSPTGVAPVAGTVLAVLASLGFRRAAQPSSIVHAAQRRVPVAPALRPSFTPD